MNKLVATLVAVIFGFASVSAFAADFHRKQRCSKDRVKADAGSLIKQVRQPMQRQKKLKRQLMPKLKESRSYSSSQSSQKQGRKAKAAADTKAEQKPKRQPKKARKPKPQRHEMVYPMYLRKAGLRSCLFFFPSLDRDPPVLPRLTPVSALNLAADIRFVSLTWFVISNFDGASILRR